MRDTTYDRNRRLGSKPGTTPSPKKGFARIKKVGVAKLKARGNRTAKGKVIRDPEAYVAGGLRRTGIAKLGEKEFTRRQAAGRRRR